MLGREQSGHPGIRKPLNKKALEFEKRQITKTLKIRKPECKKILYKRTSKEHNPK